MNVLEMNIVIKVVAKELMMRKRFSLSEEYRMRKEKKKWEKYEGIFDVIYIFLFERKF